MCALQARDKTKCLKSSDQLADIIWMQEFDSVSIEKMGSATLQFFCPFLEIPRSSNQINKIASLLYLQKQTDLLSVFPTVESLPLVLESFHNKKNPTKHTSK